MTTFAFTPRLLDHLVLPVATLANARARLASLGFTVAADARHPFGTENACVYFADNTYLEPLAVTDPSIAAAAAAEGNVFVARDRAFRAAVGEEGFSGMVAGTPDAAADDRRFRDAGLSAGAMLSFERPVRMPDGTELTAGFKLAFAGDRRAPNFLLFACERINPLPADRSALQRHDNGVGSIVAITLAADVPADFQSLLQTVYGAAAVPDGDGFSVMTSNATISVLTPRRLREVLEIETPAAAGPGLRGAAVTFRCADLEVTAALLAANGVAFQRQGLRLLVPPAPGQGITFIFQEPAE